MSNPPVSVGDVARRFGVPLYAVRRLFGRDLPLPHRGGQCRMIAVDLLPQIAKALKAHGYSVRELALK